MDSQGNSIPLFSSDDGAAIGAASNKQLVYLDSNIWIDMAERAPDVAERCRAAVRTGKVLFPVSSAAVSEVLEQPDSGQRSNVATLMDDLSGGVSFRPTAIIHTLEADLSLPILLGRAETAIGRKQILCWIAECFARMSIQIPASWDQTKTEKFTREFSQQPELRSVRWLVDQNTVKQMQARQVEWETHYVQKMAVSIAEGAVRVEHLAKDERWRQLLLEERIWAVKKFVSPRITKSLIEVVGPEKLLNTMAEILRHVGEGSEHRLKQIMEAMPSLDLLCHIMAERRRDPSRKVYKQDFHDVEHAIVGSVYADVFATSDRHLFDLLTKRCTIPAARGCCVVKGIPGLVEALNSLCRLA